MDTTLLELRRTIALGCRILAATGATTPILGHVSHRLPDGRVLVRCRGPQESGLLFTTVDDIRLVELDDSGEVGDGYRLPNEYPIHAEILRARPDVASVVHAHPVAAVVAGLADRPLRPVVGAFNIPAYRMAADGVPLWPHRGLVRTAEAGRSLAATLGDGSAALLLGHGVVTVGDNPRESVLRTLDLDELARLTVAVAGLDGRPDEVSEADRADLPDLGSAFNEAVVWRYHVRRLALRGLDDVDRIDAGKEPR
ncbi:class II aldolase/adducin family protein [Nocardioides sp. BP30]|uniref:class II aldolase/adducin family protein n=1 Tax=Nocardioides sp. BP30 TaxID=3036374 RepID=UPI002469311E|nr:class II aldolase/adducin family protein [Nocardioides sp. BP30]WGL52480.1 class II aldolase/adducin family protein [Nocardioides sp. BP30]